MPVRVDPWLGQNVTLSFAEYLKFLLFETTSYDAIFLKGNFMEQTPHFAVSIRSAWVVESS